MIAVSLFDSPKNNKEVHMICRCRHTEAAAHAEDLSSARFWHIKTEWLIKHSSVAELNFTYNHNNRSTRRKAMPVQTSHKSTLGYYNV